MKLKDYCIKERKEYLLTEWDDEKNLPFTPETISHTSSLPVWWKCEKGHSWQTQLRSRSTTLTKCPKYRDAKLNKSRKLKAKELARRLKTEYVKVMDTYKVAFETLAEGCETQEDATINAGSQKLEEAVGLLDEYNKALETIAIEYDLEVEY